MVCFTDDSRLITLQALFTLGYVVVLSLRQWSAIAVMFQDWTVKYLIALKLTFLTRAIIESLAVGVWPSNTGSQIWLVLIVSVFYLSVIEMMLASTLVTSLALVSFLFGLSFLGSVWQSLRELFEQSWLTAFGHELSDAAAAAVLILGLAVVGCICLSIAWKGWLHTIIIGLLVALDSVVGSHLLAYNTAWSPGGATSWLTTTICCTLPDATNLAVNTDGNLCPLRFTWYDCGVLVVALLLMIPLQFYRREQCTSVWCCCRSRARALHAYWAQKGEYMYGHAPAEDDSCDEDDAVSLLPPRPARDEAHWMSPTEQGAHQRWD